MNTNSLKKHLSATDHLVSKKQFDLLYDSQLEMLITSPQPKPEDLPKYYQSDEYISHTDSNKTLTDRIYQQVKKFAIKSKLKLVKKQLGKKGSLLDVGAGTGDFLEHAKSSGWEISGIETNPQAIALAGKKGVALSKDRFALDNQKFDVITFWHVLEHLPDYREYLDWCSTHLNPGGILIIAVPNFKSWDARHFKSFWAAYDVPRHLWHFSKTSIAKLTQDKFELQKIKPMWFDSVYVSLLSIKNKTGNANLLKAIMLGFWSNLRGIGSKEFSSHIYVLKKP